MSIFFDNLEQQRRLGGRAVAACSAALAAATCVAWGTLHTSGLGALAALAVAALMIVVSGTAAISSTSRMAQGVLLMTQVSLLVGAFSGNAWQIDMHMSYFAALGVLAIFADWTVILVAAATVALHHLTLSFILPSLVFYGGGGIGRVLVHAVILIAEAATLMWTAANNVRMLDEVKVSLEEASRAAAEAQQAQEAAIMAIQTEGETRMAVDQERAEAQTRLTTVVGSLANALSHLASGDLSCRINEPFGDEFEALRLDFNAAVEQLAETLAAVVGQAGDLRSGAGEITQAADDLAMRTERQAASLNETAAALEEVTVTVRNTAEGATRASRLVTDTRQQAERSGLVVTDAVTAMSAIEQSARKISQIIGVIDEIAFQTNLLALNAGVEAARAGDAGRGFAVVASEVRALAQRSADAAKEIKALISDSSQQVEQGVDLVGRTGESLHGIVDKVAEVAALVETIAASAQEQASGLNQVNTAVNEMDAVTQQNAAMVEESTAASHRLAREAESLGQLVARFNLGSTAVKVAASGGSSRTVSAPQRSAPAPQRRAAAKPTADARALQTKIAEQWEEF